MSSVAMVASAPAVGLASCAFRAIAAVCLLAVLRGVASRQAEAAGRIDRAA
jgi:hypothetical protein